MVRFIGMAAGAVFVLTLFIALVAPRDRVDPDPLKELHRSPRAVHFQQDGPLGLGVFGTFDRAQLQRGYQVYTQVCAACHALDLVAFRNLEGIGFSPAEVRALARSFEIPDVDPDTGEPATRPGLPADHFPGPYLNEVQARAANNNALPPDLSLMVKARPNGQRYLYSLLVGYEAPPPGFEMSEGLYFNPYFHSVMIAMAPPLTDGQLTYADGTNATIGQMSRDVTAFLAWTAEPTLEVRRRWGIASVLFLTILSLLAYLSYRRVWATVQK